MRVLGWRLAVVCVGLAILTIAIAALGRRAPPFREVSDGAVLEIYTLEALEGRLLVGPYSRFGWHHPGPLFFYFEAPWYCLSWRHTVGMQYGALIINVAAVAVIVWSLAQTAPAPLAAAVSMAIAFFVWRTGDMIVSVWNPHIIILPMLAFVVVAAAYAASGAAAFLFWMILIGSFLVQTHLAMAPVVALPGLLSIVGARDRTTVRRTWLLVVFLPLVLWMPPLVEQITRTPGNMTRIARFFLGSASHGQPLGTAVTAWSAALTAAFGRGFEVATGWDLEPQVSKQPLAWSLLLVCASGAAASVAWRRRDRFSLWLTSLCALTSLVALVATTRIRGQIVDHEVFWMSALGVLNVGAIVGLVTSLIADTGSNRRLSAAAISVAALLVALGTGVLGMHHAMNRRRTLEDHAVDVLAEKIRTAMSEAHATRPLFHIEPPIWTIAAGALLQIRKDGAAFAVDPQWTVMFGEAFEPDGREDARLTLAGSIRLPIVTKTP